MNRVPIMKGLISYVRDTGINPKDTVKLVINKDMSRSY